MHWILELLLNWLKLKIKFHDHFLCKVLLFRSFFCCFSILFFPSYSSVQVLFQEISVLRFLFFNKDPVPIKYSYGDLFNDILKAFFKSVKNLSRTFYVNTDWHKIWSSDLRICRFNTIYRLINFYVPFTFCIEFRTKNKVANNQKHLFILFLVCACNKW